MLGFVLCAVLAQSPTLTDEEIRARLKAPISLKTEPVRLPVALDQIGNRIGVRIRCEAVLQPAVVVVGVSQRPAEEVVAHLLNGIGAASMIRNGTLIVGLPVSGEKSAKQIELELKAIDSMIEHRAKALKIDEPLDETIATRTAALAVQGSRSSEGGRRMPYSIFYQAAAQSPANRVAIALMRAVGSELLRTADEQIRTIEMGKLDADKLAKAREALGRYAKEQAAWSAAFASYVKVAQANPELHAYGDLFEKAMPLDGSPTSFRIVTQTSRGARWVQVEILSGGEPSIQIAESLPVQRVYTSAPGQPFNFEKANALQVNLGERVVRWEKYCSELRSGKPSALDPRLMRELADPWNFEPLALSRAQPIAEVAERLDLDAICYLNDQLLGYVINQYSPDSATVSGTAALNTVQMGWSTGLRTKDGWLLGYVNNPEGYLANQLNRAALGKMCKLALKPGALTFDQHLDLRKDLPGYQFQIARQFASLARPGFNSLNPVSIEVLDLFRNLRPGQLSQAKSAGIPYASLPPDLQLRLKQSFAYQGRGAKLLSDDSVDSPTTIDDIRKSRLFVAQLSKVGLLLRPQPQEFGSYANPFVDYRFTGFGEISADNPLSSARSILMGNAGWPARQDTIQFRLEIPRKHTQGFSAIQYITDITLAPVTEQQAAGLIAEHGNRGG